jgi:hypothetical protein
MPRGGFCFLLSPAIHAWEIERAVSGFALIAAPEGAEIKKRFL